MKKIILTKGLPGSGKTVWSKEYQAKNPNTVRVNKDELRAMLHDSIWSHGREDFILKVRNFIVEETLKNGHDVIVDDTNLHSKHKNEMWKIAAANNANVEEKSFLDVPIEECIKRDLKRINSVGEKVIKKMYSQFLSLKIEYKPDPNLPQAVIVDLDGTLALFGDKNPYDRDFENDEVNIPVLKIIKYFEDMHRIIFVSGRKSKYRSQTVKWLRKQLGWLTKDIEAVLFMPRADGDNRKDIVIKQEIFNQHIKDNYNVLFVLDDRPIVVKMWREELGLFVFDCNQLGIDF